MAFNPTGHAVVDINNPDPFAVCDRCGFLYNHSKLNWQYEWSGADQVNLRILVCPQCLDTPNEQLRTIILPSDPVPIKDPRFEPYKLEEGALPPPFDGRKLVPDE